MHPGGEKLIEQYAGVDATEAKGETERERKRERGPE